MTRESFFNVSSIVGLFKLKADKCGGVNCGVVVVGVFELVLGVGEGKVVGAFVVDVEAGAEAEVEVGKAERVEGETEGRDNNLCKVEVSKFCFGFRQQVLV